METKPLPPKMKNAPQVCCLSTRLRGLLSVVLRTVLELRCKYNAFFSLDNAILLKNHTFHIFSLFQSSGNPIALRETTSLYSSKSSIKRCLKGEVGLAVCNM